MGGRGSVKELAEKDQKKLQLFLHEFNLKWNKQKTPPKFSYFFPSTDSC